MVPGTLFSLNSVLQLKVDMGLDPEAAFTPWDDNFCHFCEPCQPTDADLFASVSLSKHVGPTRAAVLLLKLISLASSAKGAADFNLTAWHALKLLCDRIHQVKAFFERDHMLGYTHEAFPDDKYNDEQVFFAHLTQLVLPILRQCAKSDEVESTVCCRLLIAVMHASKLHHSASSHCVQDHRLRYNQQCVAVFDHDGSDDFPIVLTISCPIQTSFIL